MSRLKTTVRARPFLGAVGLAAIGSLGLVACATDVVLGEHLVGNTSTSREPAPSAGFETETGGQGRSEDFESRDDSNFVRPDRDGTRFFDGWDAGPPPRPPRPGDGFPPDEDGPLPPISDVPFIFEPPQTGEPPP
jgi:hypothetical protein